MINAPKTNGPVRREPNTKSSFAKSALLVTSGISGVMLGLAMPNLVGGSALMITIKSILLAAGGMTVAYAVNRLAVERGAPLAVAGYGWAGGVSAASILIVGGGLFPATYAGLVFDDVEQLTIEAHGEALSGFVSGRSAVAAKSAGIAPAINTIVSDLTQKRDCEISESCISGHAGGGNGPVARFLTEKLGKAVALAQQVERGEAAREAALERVNALHGEYQAAAMGDLSMEEKRRTLRGIDLTIRQAVSDLDEAIPVALLTAYGEELKAGAEIEGRPDVSRKITGILHPHGSALVALARALPDRGDTAPAFPKQTGVSDTFEYVGHFLPIAAITAVVELVFPISLWLYTLFALNWSAYRASPPPPRLPHPDDAYWQRPLPGPDTAGNGGDRASDSDRAPDEPRRERRGYRRPSSFLNGRRRRGGR